jgi:GDPmannose 4,6-dehydratase
MSKHRTVITGITGQDGSYLADKLLDSGNHDIYGLVRRSASPNFDRIKGIKNRVNIIYGDICDPYAVGRLIKEVQPAYVYNLAAQSFVGYSFKNPKATMDANIGGVLNILEAIKAHCPEARFYQASSSEMFGKIRETPQVENTAFHPRSPYGVSKCAAHWLTQNYRESYGLWACNGILFNHESERRGLEFVTRKITRGAASIKMGLQSELLLGNLDSKRDWGYAPDYVNAMVMMLDNDEPTDYVVGTGKVHSVRDFCKGVFECLNLNWEDYVKIDKRFYRPAEVDYLQADYSKIAQELKWSPSVTFEQMIEKMVFSDMKALEEPLKSYANE